VLDQMEKRFLNEVNQYYYDEGPEIHLYNTGFL
jgi:hypothetical protein